MLQLRRHLTYANVTATLALVIALSTGTAWAAKTVLDGRNLTNGSVGGTKLAANAVTTAKVKNGTLLATDFKKGQLPAGAQGPKGADGTNGTNGTNGAAGTPGAPATALWAVIHPGTGQPIAESGVDSSFKGNSGTGGYEVVFDRDVTDCAYIATVGGGDAARRGGDGVPVSDTNYSVATAPLSTNGNGVAVTVYQNEDAAMTGPATLDAPFTLAVFC